MSTRPHPLSSPVEAVAHAWVAASLLAAAIVVAYAGSLDAPFVYDDILAIPQNPTIRQWWPLKAVLWPQSEGGLTVSGRPVLNLSFAVNYAISGADVWSYHVFNVLVHTASALLLFGLCRRMLPAALGRPAAEGRGAAATNLAVLIAALWALHPVATQAVTYTVQRAESLMGFFYLLTLYAFARAIEVDAAAGNKANPSRRGWQALSVLSCVLGMGTKEVMATAPLMVLLFDRTFVAGSIRAAWRKSRIYYSGLAATWVVLAALVISTGGNRGGTVGIGTGVPLWAYPLTQFEAVARYLGLAVWPQPLVFEYGTFWVQRLQDVAPYAAVVMPLLVATVVALKKWPKPGFFGASFFLILAPTSLAPGTIQMIVEHRMYLPLAVLVAATVVGAHRCLGKRAMVSAALAAVAFGLLAYQRNHDYRSPLALWSDTVAKRPGNPRAHDGLAEAFEGRGRIADALVHRREAVRLQPDESRYHYNLALTLAAAGQREEAVQHYQASLRLTPGEARTHNNLAILLGAMGNADAALAHYAAAVQLKPEDSLYHYNHGVALMRAGRYADAVQSFESALRLRNDYADARFNLGTALVRANRLDEALARYAEALNSRPADPEYRTAFGGALLLANRPSDALVEFRRVVAEHPGHIEAMFGVGNALTALRRTREAVAQYESVLRLDPRHASAHFKLGNALLDLDDASGAVAHYLACLRHSPADAEAHHNLGVAYARLERWLDARGEFETALRLKPDYRDARRNLDQLKAVLGPQ
jgi:tetratricopeptide (TPR) repeat protein